MGCFDIYCLACGLPCHRDKEYIIEVAEETGDEYIIKEAKKVIKKTGYLNNNIFLTSDNRVIRNCIESSCNVIFVSPTGEKLIQTGYRGHGGEMPGIIIHTSCWNWIKNTYDIKIKYSDLPINKDNVNRSIRTNDPIYGINYGTVTKYQKQFFDFIEMIENNDIYMLDKKNEKNITRMKKIFAQYKINSDRVGPSMSATFFKDGVIKIGNNKNFWIKKHGKWQEIKEKIITKSHTVKKINKRQRKYIDSVPFIGEFNQIPLFKSKVVENKNNMIINVKGTEYGVDLFHSILNKK
jgi:hypothetical protein